MVTLFLEGPPVLVNAPSRLTTFTSETLGECDLPPRRALPIGRGLPYPDEISPPASGDDQPPQQGPAVLVPGIHELGFYHDARPAVEERNDEDCAISNPAPSQGMNLSRPAKTRERAVFENLIREACLTRGDRWPEHRNADLRAAAEVICNPQTAQDFFAGYVQHLSDVFNRDQNRRHTALENLRWALVRCRPEGRRAMWEHAVGLDLWRDGPLTLASRSQTRLCSRPDPGAGSRRRG